jgi:acetylornithine deacetylase/succinyl-diaminopimelate desuccinylase family protein
MRLSRTQRLLCDLIALPSVNPVLLPAGHEWGGEKKVAEFAASYAAEAGLEVELMEVAPQRPNVIARLRPQGRVRHRVLLAPHLDTVGATDISLKPRIEAGRIHGRGACDTKGSVAVMLAAVAALARTSGPRHTEVVFAGLVDEEAAQAGSRALVKSGFKADLGIVGEATQCKVVTAHKGNVWVRIQTRGRAAHGSRPELGSNAIVTMAHIIELLQSSYAVDLAKRKHDLLGKPTVNIGTIVGGQQPNIVPDFCEIRLDRRTLPGETTASVLSELRSAFRGAGVRARVSSDRFAPCDPMETNARLPLVIDLMKACKQSNPEAVDYFCDASILSAGGTPSVVFGPGDIAQAHTVDEWVEVASLERAFQCLWRFLQDLP